jgi:trans-aconitate methyltransferase
MVTNEPELQLESKSSIKQILPSSSGRWALACNRVDTWRTSYGRTLIASQASVAWISSPAFRSVVDVLGKVQNDN